MSEDPGAKEAAVEALIICNLQIANCKLNVYICTMRRRHNGMRPQDLVVLLKIIILENTAWQNKDLANTLFISASEISESLERSRYAGLIDQEKKRVQRGNLVEFLIYGMKYAFPAIPGIITRGIPTAHSHPFVKQFIHSNQDYVWTSTSGEVIGQSIEPFYATQDKAILEDAELYKLLAFLDMIRVGRLREVTLAKQELIKLLDDVRTY